jgi:hypothetical protein
MSKTLEWDSLLHRQVERDCTPAEEDEIAARKAAPPHVPAEVPMASARIILLRNGHDDAGIRAAINNSAMTAQQKAEALIDWEFRPTVRRGSALTLTLAAILAMPGAQVDAMFIEAVAL